MNTRLNPAIVTLKIFMDYGSFSYFVFKLINFIFKDSVYILLFSEWRLIIYNKLFIQNGEAALSTETLRYTRSIHQKVCCRELSFLN